MTTPRLYGPGEGTDIFQILTDLAVAVQALQLASYVADGAVSDAQVAANANIAQSKIAGLVTKLNNLVAADAAETAARTAADSNEANVRAGAITAEANARMAADTTEATARAAGDALSLLKGANLADLASAATARANLGLGSAATASSSDFDPQGAAAAAQAAAIQRANHTGTQPAATISDFLEAAQDAVGAALLDTPTLDLTYDDAAGTVSGAVLNSPKVAGVTVTGVPTAGQLLGATGAAAATWQDPPSAPVSSVNARTGAVTGLAEDSAVVHLSGPETVAGVKTFSAAPVVPVGAFPEAAVANLVTDLASKETPAGAQAKVDAAAVLALQKASNLSDLANAGVARSNMGLGSMATQDATGVAITGGTVTGITDLAIVDGGTGASTAATARANLGAAADVVDASPATGSLRTLGTGANQAAAGNDGRLSDMRTPLDGSVTTAKIGPAGIAESSVANLPADLAARAMDSTVVHNTGAETVAGVKTFSAAPVVPTNAFPESAVAGLVADLAARAPLGGPFAPTITGALAATRYVGGTTAGAPTSGTFTAGDFIIDQTGKLWICTLAGSPGTWAQAGAVTSVNGRAGAVTGLAEDANVVHLTGAESIGGVKTFSSAPVVPAAAFPESAVANLASDLAARAPLTTTYGGGVRRVNEGPLSLLDPRLVPGDPALVTDWGAVLNAAKALLPASAYRFDPRGGGHIYIPPGIYPMTTGFTYDSPNIIIEGAGNGTLFLAKTNNMEMFSATAVDAYGISGCQLLNLRLMADQGVTGVKGFASHAYHVGGDAVGGFSGWVIHGIFVQPTSGGLPIYGNLDIGLYLDFFIESKVHAWIIGCAGLCGIFVTNNTNVTDIDGFSRVNTGWGMIVEDGSYPRTMPGWTCEGNGAGGLLARTAAWPRLFGPHFEQTGGISTPDIKLESAASVTMFGGELVYAEIADGCYDWGFFGVQRRGSVDAAAGFGTGVITGGAGGWTDPSGRVSIGGTRDSGGVVRSVWQGFSLPAGTVNADNATGTTIGAADAKLGAFGKAGVSRPAVFGGSDSVKLANLISALDTIGWVKDLSATATTDPFTRGNNASSMGVVPTTGMPWQAIVGTWGIIGNQAYCSAHVGFDLVVVETGRADCTVGADLATVGGAGLIFRYQDPSNYWLVTNGGQELYKVIAGSFTSMYGGTVGADGDHLDVVLSGSSITLKRNGTTLTTVTDTALATATKHGLSNLGAGSPAAARIDNFSVA